MRFRITLLLWFLTDVLFFVGSYALAYFMRVGWILSTAFPFAPFIEVAAVVAPLWLIVLASTRIFTLSRTQHSLRNALSLVFANVVGLALFALTYYFLFDLFFSRLLLVEAFLLSVIILWIWHIVFEWCARRTLWRNPQSFPTLIVGVTRESKALIALLRESKNPLKPVAILDAHGAKEKEIEGVPVLGKLDKLEETIATFRISHLIQCSNLEHSINLLSACRSRGITYLLLPSVLGIVERDERIESIEGHAVVMVNPSKSRWVSFFAP